VKKIVHVVRSPHGWWDVRNQHGDILVRSLSEFQAIEAGRGEADRQGAELLVHAHADPPQYHVVEPMTVPDRRPSVEGLSRPVPDASGRRQLILLVEDSVDLREFYAEYLTYAGFSVVTAINGHEALRMARLLRPDLVLMDLRMPGMDGLEATADLKRNPDLAHIPVVAFTADVTPDVAARARHAGCAEFIAKPAVPDDVARTIADVLGRNERVVGL
jgi:two-component system, cell cycle response regulator DivK